MTLTIEIDMAYAAFSDNPNEIKDILAKTAEWAEGKPRYAATYIRDSNGNTVGQAKIK